MLNDSAYIKIKGIMMRNGAWADKYEEIENEMKRIALKMV